MNGWMEKNDKKDNFYIPFFHIFTKLIHLFCKYVLLFFLHTKHMHLYCVPNFFSEICILYKILYPNKYIIFILMINSCNKIT